METPISIDEIKRLFVNLICENHDGFYFVGFRGNRGKSFLVQGTGATEEDAYNEAYEWLTKTGQYDVDKYPS